VSFPARAGSKEDLGANILSCFHPTGRFRSVAIGDPYKNGNGQTAADGRVNFLGALTDNRYHMDFTMQLRKVDGKLEFRVVPGEDTAPFPPAPNCRLRSWTEME
jgi:hypothetical protein